MAQKYVMIVRDRICMFRSVSDEMLKACGCYYKSPIFSWNGSLASADTIIDKYRKQFGHMIDWTATFVSV